MNITQGFVDRIVRRAKNSQSGLEDSEKKRPYDISNYETPNLHALAIMLVSAHHSKWDIISIVTAALEELEEELKS